MNTYRVYVLNTTVALQPAVHVAYVQAPKYGDAWSAKTGARRALIDGTVKLFADPDCKVPAKVGHGDAYTVAKIEDIKQRNKKLDKAALQAILDDPKASDTDKLKAMKEMIA